MPPPRRGRYHVSAIRDIAQRWVERIPRLLDQKYELQKSIATIMEDTRVHDIESYAIHGVLIVGMMPANPDHPKSFELFRANSKDVAIFTFDEVLEKLKLLLQFLSDRSSVPGAGPKLVQLETRLLKLQHGCSLSYEHTRVKSKGIVQGTSTPRNGVDGKRMISLIGSIAPLKSGFERARVGEPPFPLRFQTGSERAVSASTIEDFLPKAPSELENLQAALKEAWPNRDRDLPDL